MLEGLFPAAKRKLSPALDSMSSIIKLGRACGINRRILFRPTLSRNAEVTYDCFGDFTSSDIAHCSSFAAVSCLSVSAGVGNGR